MSTDKLETLADAGLDEFLVSRHGPKNVHNFICNYPGAYERQTEFLEKLKAYTMTLRFNVVINHFNEGLLLGIAKEIETHKPKAVNFINMNPHNDWMDKTLETKDVIADLRIVQPDLEAAARFLYEHKVAVNIRYYPMCRLHPDLRYTICNDLHVTFDPWEWDYLIQPKSYEAHRDWGIGNSQQIEEKGEPCNICTLGAICGGINKAFHRAANDLFGEICIPETVEPTDKDDFYHYRRNQAWEFKTVNISGSARMAPKFRGPV